MNKITINVNGKDYRLVTESEPEHIQGIEKELNDQINSLCGKRIDIGFQDALVLIALNLFDARSSNEEKIKELTNEITQLKAQNFQLQSQIEAQNLSNKKLQDLLNEAAEQISIMSEQITICSDKEPVEEAEIEITDETVEHNKVYSETEKAECEDDELALEETEKTHESISEKAVECKAEEVPLDENDEALTIDDTTENSKKIEEKDNFSAMLDYIIESEKEDADAQVEEIYNIDSADLSEDIDATECADNLLKNEDKDTLEPSEDNYEDMYPKCEENEEVIDVDEATEATEATEKDISEVTAEEMNNEFNNILDNAQKVLNEVIANYEAQEEQEDEKPDFVIPQGIEERTDFRNFDATNSFVGDSDMQSQILNFSSEIDQRNEEAEQLRHEVERIKKRIPIVRSKRY